MVVARAIAGFLFSGENALVGSYSQIQRLMDEMSGRTEHCFTSQRTRFEGSNVVVKHVHDFVNEFLGKTHATVMDRSGNCTEVDRSLCHPNERPHPSAERLS